MRMLNLRHSVQLNKVVASERCSRLGESCGRSCKKTLLRSSSQVADSSGILDRRSTLQTWNSLSVPSMIAFCTSGIQHISAAEGEKSWGCGSEERNVSTIFWTSTMRESHLCQSSLACTFFDSLLMNSLRRSRSSAHPTYHFQVVGDKGFGMYAPFSPRGRCIITPLISLSSGSYIDLRVAISSRHPSSDSFSQILRRVSGLPDGRY